MSAALKLDPDYDVDIVPDHAMMVRHLTHLFGGDLGKFADGLIEIAYGKHNLNQAKLFPATELGIQSAATLALLENGRGSNVYVGIALRKPTTAPFGRTNDTDFYCATAVVFDLDDEGLAQKAKNVWTDMPPTLCVLTGLQPYARMQAWFRLFEPLSNATQFTQLQATLAAAFKGDTTVTNPSRVMRLAGSIAWPTKPGRVKERAYIHSLNRQGTDISPDDIIDRWSQLTSAVQTAPGKASSSPRVNSLGITFSRNDEELQTVLETSREPTKWHQSMRSAVATMVGRDWTNLQIRLACAPYCNAGADDPDLDPLINTARRKWDKPGVEHAGSERVAASQQQLLITATPFVWVDPKTMPRRLFLYGYHYIRRFASSTISPGGVGKSSLTMVEAIAMATGKPLLGIKPAGKLKVWIWNGEDPREELERRVAAICLKYGIRPEELDGQLFLDSGRENGITIATSERNGVQIATPTINAIKQQIIERKIDVMIVDPFVSSHRVTENDNNAIDMVAKEWSGIADVCNCAIELVHHSRKTRGEEVSVEDSRGASALNNAVRSARSINQMSKEEAKAAKVDNHRLHFKEQNGKANMAPPSDEADWYKIIPIDLGNGDGLHPSDKVAVVEAWAWPDLLAGYTAVDADRVFAKIRAGEWLESPNSKDRWVGVAVADGLGLSDDTATVKAWLKEALSVSKTLTVVKRMDPSIRQERKFVVVSGSEV